MVSLSAASFFLRSFGQVLTCGQLRTILRPVAFMDNLSPGMQGRVFVAAFRNIMKDKPLQWVATVDIGAFAAKAFADPDHWNRRAMGLAGDEINIDQVNDAFLRTTGKPVPESFSFMGSVLTTLVSEMGTMIRWFVSDGYKADIPACRKENPRMLTMEEWIKKESGHMTQ
jgi:hypothetical protein